MKYERTIGFSVIVGTVLSAIFLPMTVRATAFTVVGVGLMAVWAFRTADAGTTVGFNGGTWKYRGHLVGSPFDTTATNRFLVQLSQIVAKSLEGGSYPDGSAIVSPVAEQPEEEERSQESPATGDPVTTTPELAAAVPLAKEPAATVPLAKEPAATVPLAKAPKRDAAPEPCAYGCGNPSSRLCETSDGAEVNMCEACYTVVTDVSAAVAQELQLTP